MEGMHALFDAHTPTFPTVNILSSSFFEICQPPDDSSRMKQAVCKYVNIYKF